MRRYHEIKCYVVDLTCNCNCFEGTERECQEEIDELVNHYHHQRDRYAISTDRWGW